MSDKASLKRMITLPLLVFYGVGTILGAGIYALIGKIAGLSGKYAPFSFLLSALIAAFIALTYAELSSRYPNSAGEAVYVSNAFSKRWLTRAVGYAIALTGIVSAAVMARGFYGYLNEFIAIPVEMAIVLFVILIAGIAIMGIGLSVHFAFLATLIEMSGILLVIFVSREHLVLMPDSWMDYVPPLSWPVWRTIILGAFLAFYAFIGFEDMVNVAEEVIAPEKNLPTAIILALTVSALFYVGVSLAAVSSLPIPELAEHDAPFALIIEQNSKLPVELISLISLFAILNGALVQIVMASRVLYGMAEKGFAPRLFSIVNPKTRTPATATVFIAALLLIMALGFPIVELARITSFIILTVFALVNLSLFSIKLKEKRFASRAHFGIPMLVPGIGFLLCAGFIMMQLFSR
ncbi:MAG: APC family permease [Gammaproteobacteria bacterium]